MRRAAPASARLRSPGFLVALAALALWAAACPRPRPRPDELPLSFRKAEDAFRLGDLDRAARAYRAFLRESPEDHLSPRAYYRLAQIEVARGRHREALALLDELGLRFPDRQWPRAQALRARAWWALGYRITAVQAWDRALRAATGPLRRELESEVRAACAQLSPRERERALPLVASETVRDALRSPGPPPGQAGAAASLPTPQAGRAGLAPTGAGVRVGVLVPLSGRYRTYGQRTLDGVRLALSSTALAVRETDSGGDPGMARQGLDRLAGDPAVVAVIGPLRGAVAERVAPRAEAVRIPLLVLAPREVPVGRYAMQPAMTESSQARALVGHARERMGVTRFAVIHPANGWGTALAEAFGRSVRESGSLLVGVSAYMPGTTGFGVELATLGRWIERDGLEALFLPDTPERAARIAVEARRLHPGIALLGSAAWRSPTLAAAPAELDGAIFPDGFFAESARAATREFVARFREAYGRDPDLLEALGYDAARLVLAALAEGASGREALAQELLRERTVEGAAGEILVAGGRMLRRPFLVELRGGFLREISAGITASGGGAPQPLRGHWKTSLDELEDPGLLAAPTPMPSP